MTNSLSERDRKRLISRLKLQRELQRRGSDSHPRLFRELIRLPASEPVPLRDVAQPWQAVDFCALDVAWLSLAGRSVAAACRRAYLERPRGHSKTTDLAVQVAWVLQYAKQPVRGIAAAADRDQAALLHRAASDLVRLNPVLCPDLVARKSALVNPQTGSRLDVISSDVRSSWGQLPDFVICDELCHWEKPDLWHSLLSSAAKKPHSILIVLTNAGVGTDWHWTVREAARTSPDWHFSSLAGSQAPWITASALEEQRRLLPPAVYARLWDNVWQQSDGGFLTLAEAEACRDPQLAPRDRGEPETIYFAAIDYAEKRDRTVGVVLHREGERIVVDRMDVAAPTPDAPVPVQWVEDWIVRMAHRFRSIRFIVDEYQLVGTLQKFAGRYDLERFEFHGGRGNHALALLLRHLVVERRLAWFPDCGRVASLSSRDDLETELASLLLKTTPNGRVRIAHRANGHDDRAFTLGAACLAALRHDPTSAAFELWRDGV